MISQTGLVQQCGKLGRAESLHRSRHVRLGGREVIPADLRVRLGRLHPLGTDRLDGFRLPGCEDRRNLVDDLLRAFLGQVEFAGDLAVGIEDLAVEERILRCLELVAFRGALRLAFGTGLLLLLAFALGLALGLLSVLLLSVASRPGAGRFTLTPSAPWELAAAVAREVPCSSM